MALDRLRKGSQRSILQLGNPDLRRVAQPVEDVHAPEIQKLVKDLLAALKASNGVGIAAPQVGEPYCLLVVASRPNLRYPYAPKMAPTVLVNPRVLAHGDEMVKGWEGCLSVPGIRAQVPRYREIEVEYCDRNGQIQRQVWCDFVARIFQHEYDHLEGRVFLDRIDSTADIVTEQEYFARFVAG